MARNASHFLFTKAYRDEQRAEEKARAKRDRERAIFGVFQHSSGADGGYVAREGIKRDDGTVSWPSPYTSPVKTFGRRSDADKHAHRLTFG